MRKWFKTNLESIILFSGLTLFDIGLVLTGLGYFLHIQPLFYTGIALMVVVLSIAIIIAIDSIGLNTALVGGIVAMLVVIPLASIAMPFVGPFSFIIESIRDHSRKV